MKGLSNTQRTLRALRQGGYICEIAERWIQYGPGDPRRKFATGMRKDMFGFIDIIAITPLGLCAIQSTGSDFAAHDRLILENEIAPEWMTAGGRIELWGWRKVKLKRGGKAMRWKPRIKVYTLEDFE